MRFLDGFFEEYGMGILWGFLYGLRIYVLWFADWGILLLKPYLHFSVKACSGWTGSCCFARGNRFSSSEQMPYGFGDVSVLQFHGQCNLGIIH
jgi:hypothetical protein